MARMSAITFSRFFASCGKERASSYSGHFATMRASPSCGSVCQISSVMYGINGCRSFKVLLIVQTRTRRALSALSSSAPFMRIFASSIYQSQKSSQMKS